MKELYEKAKAFAENAHKGQVRKYDGSEYITHPIAVAELIRNHVEGYSEAMVAAALLHDVIEDCGVTLTTLENEFPEPVPTMVWWLSNPSKKFPGMNRKDRKRMDLNHLKYAPPDVMTVKLADLIHNSGSIIECDPKFAEVWVAEKAALVEHFGDGDPVLYKMAKGIVDNYYGA